jgi:hypothetical protein
MPLEVEPAPRRLHRLGRHRLQRAAPGAGALEPSRSAIRLVLYDMAATSDGSRRAAAVRQQAACPVLRPATSSTWCCRSTSTTALDCRLQRAQASWYSRFDTWLPWLAMACGFTGSLLFFLLFHTLSSSRMRAVKMAKEMTRELRTSQARLQQSHHKLRRLAAHSDQIKEQERKRIAREIHDDLGQNLLVLRIDVDMLCHAHPPPPPAPARARRTCWARSTAPSRACATSSTTCAPPCWTWA